MSVPSIQAPFKHRHYGVERTAATHKETPMQKILLILSSPRGGHSYSHQIARRVVDDIKARFNGANVVVRDLARRPLPHISEAFTNARATPVEALRPAERETFALSDTLIAE